MQQMGLRPVATQLQFQPFPTLAAGTACQADREFRVVGFAVTGHVKRLIRRAGCEGAARGIGAGSGVTAGPDVLYKSILHELW